MLHRRDIMVESREHTIQIEQDLAYQRKAWKVERVGWVVMTLLVVGALLGVFGAGLLSRGQRSDGSGRLSLSYDRLARHEASSVLTLEVGDPVTEGLLEVSIDRGFLAGVELEQLLPEPDHARAAGDRVVLSFRTEPQTRPSVITFFFRPVEIGRRHARLSVAGVPGSGVEFVQWVLP
jgi:hypothetical protein